MLKWLNLLTDDAPTAEADLLRDLLKESPEIPDWSAAVQPVLHRLLEYNPVKRAVVCRVLDMPMFNALALPHKTVVLSQLLVEFCRDRRDQIAFVLAHEVAHIYLGHVRKRDLANTVMAVAPVANPLLGMGLRWLFNRAYTREQEFEADNCAFRFCVRAGFDPEASITLLERLGSTEPPGNSVTQILATHPPVVQRVIQLRTAIHSWKSGNAKS
jgi:predicted Zn-dependent protease